MRRVASLVAVVAALWALSAAWLAHRHAVLEVELSAARQRALGLERLRAQNARLERAAAQLAALKRLRDERAAAEAQGSPEGAAPLAKGFLSRADLQDLGNKTPADTLETFWWALDRLDIKTLAGLFYFDPALKKRLETFYAGLPEDVRSRYGSASELYALLYASDHPLYFAGAHVSGVDTPTAYEAYVSTAFEYDNGERRDHPRSEILFRSPGQGWQLPVGDGPLNAMVRTLSASP